MKTISEVRLTNAMRLVEQVRQEDGATVTAAHIATRLGITAAYFSQLQAGKRADIGDAAARKIERSMEKDEGWMDTDFDLWPFPDADLLADVEALTEHKRIELQAFLRDKLHSLLAPTPRTARANFTRSDILPEQLRGETRRTGRKKT